MNYAAIIFDMDGLLVDSEPVWHEVEVELIESHGYQYGAEVRQLGIGMRVEEFAATLQSHYPKLGDSPESIAAAIIGRMLQLPAERIRALPGADDIVRFAAGRGIPRAIASSSSQVIIERFVSLMGWTDLIPLRYSAEIVARGKPAPDIYLHAAEQLGIPPGRCLALEDSRLGTMAALAAGMTCYTVPDQSHTALADFTEINDKVYGSLRAVLAEFKAEGSFA